ncbi:MAG: peptide deformylase [Candidatus Lambdaproteobacteria bacterium]|nr:peptide deformylase [Candidatus Lambdaproteobacteria bacterium]
MATLTVLKYPHPLLKQRAHPVTRFDAELGRLAEDMLQTMYLEGGIGLAAIQVGQLRRLVVMDLRDAPGAPVAEEEDGEEVDRELRRNPRVFVNPVITASSGETVSEEGCLSVSEYTAEVRRAAKVALSYQTPAGEARQEEFEGLGAICIQHEIDHLNGLLFIDRLPPLKRQMVRKRLAKLARSA